jgi:hypothetical protein
MLRWHRPVCPAIVGLTQAQNEFMLGRLSQAVTDAGAPLAPENCAPNLLVPATRQPEVVLQKWWDRNPRLFNSDQGVGGIKHSLAGQTPIRAWYNAQLGCEEGAAPGAGRQDLHTGALRGWIDLEGVPNCASARCVQSRR